MTNTQQPSANNVFVQMEKKWLDHWYNAGIVQKYLHKNDASEERFSFMDGPITANNPMGVHHAWGRSYKDLWQKFHNLLGHKQRFQNGFDCQGLWVEVEVEKELGVKSKKDLEELVPGNKEASIAHFVDLCRKRVLNFSGIQTQQTKRLGNFMDWDNSYFTMSAENNYMIWHFLKKCHENGWIYKGKDTVPWCPRCETAISQHEMLTEDYQEITHETVFFKLPIQDAGFENTSLLVWTTTPWTIPANVAVAVNTKFTYYVWKNKETSDQIIMIGKDENDTEATREENRKPAPMPRYIFGKGFEETWEQVKEISGKELVGLKYKAAFDFLPIAQNAQQENPQTFHSVVDGSEIVVSTEGTGLLHVAPGAGQEDFKLGQKENLPIIAPIQDDASYVDTMGEWSGKNAKANPSLIIDFLKEHEGGKFLLKTMPYKHRYPACWRCKTELVWKVADEWYITMDKGTKDDARTLRERMMDVAKKITWMPEFGLDRELDWLKNMHDWLISKKNRYWGLALPIWECDKCGNFEVLGGEDELKARAVEGWSEFEGHTPHKPFIDAVKIKCSSCGETVTRLPDVGNVWLDAGIVPFSTISKDNKGKPLYLENREEWAKWFPVDFITESFPGQFKNWFYAMIAMSTVLEDNNPFKTVLGFATLLGEDGRAMHKSWGNSIEFNSGADEMGVDVIRWMFARQNPVDNMLFGYKKADEVRRQFYLMLWNINKFYQEYSQLDGYDSKNAEIKAISSENVLDTWIFNRFIWLVNHVETCLKEFNAKDAALEIEQFVEDVSTWYIRRSRARVGLNAEQEDDKQSFYETLHTILVQLSVMLSPFMPFMSEEIYTTLTSRESVHLAFWPNVSSLPLNEEVISDMKLVREIVEAGHRVRKEVKMKVRQPLASVTIQLPETKKLSEAYQEQYNALIADELNVKQVIFEEADGEELQASYDIILTDELKLEGELRDLIRSIQGERKAQGIKMDEKINITVPEKFSAFEDILRRSVQAENISYGDEVKVG